MITAVKIESFRGVSEGGVEGLAPISILVGPNNSGKSTVLEAIAASGLGTNAKAVAGLLMRRGGSPLDALGRVIFRSAKEAVISVKGKLDNGRVSSKAVIAIDKHLQEPQIIRREALVEPVLEFAVSATSKMRVWTYVDSQGKQYGGPGEELFQNRFVDVEAVRTAGALEDAYTRIDETGQLGKTVKSLGRAMPGLTDLRILKVGTDFVLHTFFQSGPPVPAYLAGDGFKRFLELAAAAVGTPKGVVLLEEPESFQHPRYLQELATLLHLAAREGTQIIMSTHNIELIDLLLHAPEAEEQTYPAVHRMRIFDGKLRATTIDRERAVSARDELLEDLRA